MHQIDLRKAGIVIPVTEIANDSGHSEAKFVTEKILSNRDEFKDTLRSLYTYLIDVSDIPSSNDIFMYGV